MIENIKKEIQIIEDSDELVTLTKVYEILDKYSNQDKTNDENLQFQLKETQEQLKLEIKGRDILANLNKDLNSIISSIRDYCEKMLEDDDNIGLQKTNETELFIKGLKKAYEIILNLLSKEMNK
jgi:hypothetical protein